MKKLFGTKPAEGKFQGIAFRTARNDTVRAKLETSTLGTAGSATREELYITQKLYDIHIGISDFAIRAARGKGSSVISDLWREEMIFATSDMAWKINFDIFGMGKAMGAKTPTTGTNRNYTTYDLDSEPSGNLWLVPAKPSFIYYKNTLFTETTTDISANDQAALVNKWYWDSTNNTIDIGLDTSVTSIGATDIRISLTNELTGLRHIVDNQDGPIYSVTRSASTSTDWMDSYVNDNSGTARDLTKTLIDNTLSAMYARGAKPDIAVMSYDKKMEFENVIAEATNNRITMAPVPTKFNFELPVYKGVALYADPQAPEDRIWFLQSKNFSFYELKAPTVHRIAKTDSYTSAYIETYFELACNDFYRQAVLMDLN